MACFENNILTIRELSNEYEELVDFSKFANKWIKHLKGNYGPNKKKDLPEKISVDDANKLTVEITEWMDKISETYSTDGTVLLTVLHN